MLDYLDHPRAPCYRDAEAALSRTHAPHAPRAKATLRAIASLCLLCYVLLALLPLQKASSSTITTHDTALLLFLFVVLGLLYLLALRTVLVAHEAISGREIIVWALLFRTVLLLAPAGAPALSADLHRYLWEGRVTAAGENPFRHAPDDDALSGLRASHPGLFAAVHHPSVPAVYPPLAQLTFAVLPESTFGFRLVCTAAEVLLLLLLRFWLSARGAGAARLLVYAWLPIAVIEISGSGHFEPIFLPFIVAGFLLIEHLDGMRAPLRTAALAGASFGIAAAMKLVALAPLAVSALFIARRTGQPRRAAACAALLLSAALVVVLAYLPFLDAGLRLFSGLGRYVAAWEFNGLLFYGVRNALELFGGSYASSMSSAKILAAAAAAWFGLRSLLRGGDPALSAATVFGVLLLLSPVVYPWYLLWIVPLLVVARGTFLPLYLLCWSQSVLLSYEVLAHPARWEAPSSILVLEYGGALLAALVLQATTPRGSSAGTGVPAAAGHC